MMLPARKYAGMDTGWEKALRSSNIIKKGEATFKHMQSRPDAVFGGMRLQKGFGNGNLRKVWRFLIS